MLRILLFPFAVLYDIATRFRNHLYNIEHKRSFEFDTNVISVGNLAVGGTGKSPMVEYLIRLLKDKYKVATLSRGYGRRSRGFRIAGEEDSSKTLGDEPYQFYEKFKHEVHVTVGEERALAIPQILFEREDTEVIILDDAYQHRTVKPGLSILLTEYQQPFYDDYVMPAGRLRESRRGAKRADIVVVTKCPKDVSPDSFIDYRKHIQHYTGNDTLIAFAGIKYHEPVRLFGTVEWNSRVLLFSGIAKSHLLKEYVSSNYDLIEHKVYGDHYAYSVREAEKIRDWYETHRANDAVILTTEKDMVKLLDPEVKALLEDLPLFYLPIETYFIDNGRAFDERVLKMVR
ncbi:MAG: tetraacyldisaccharide 4'-kinase [Bacteroidota bacterium]